MAARNKIGAKLSVKARDASEPTFSGPVDRITLVNTLNWYNANYTVPDCRHWLIDYMSVNGFSDKDKRAIQQVPNHKITQNLCTTARIIVRGAVFDHTLDDRLRQLIASVRSPRVVKVVYHFNRVIAHFDDVIDEFINSGYKTVVDHDVLRDNYKDGSAPDVAAAIKYYTALADEINTEKEGYDHLTLAAKRRYIALIESIVGVLGVKNKKRRVVRKRRTVNVRQKKLKVTYLSHCSVLSVTSIDPVLINSARVLWIYNRATRVLTRLEADRGKTLSVKSATVSGFNPEKSDSKRIRQTAVANIIGNVTTFPKAGVAKILSNVKQKSLVAKGRLNKHTLLLRVDK